MNIKTFCGWMKNAALCRGAATLLGLVAVLVCARPEPAGAADIQFGLMTPSASTNLASVSNATVTASDSLPIYPPAIGSDLVLEPFTLPAKAGTSNTVVGLNISTDTTNYTTTLPLSMTLTNGGSNVLTSGRFFFSRTNFYAAKAIRWDSTQTTQTNPVACGIRWAWIQ